MFLEMFLKQDLQNLLVACAISSDRHAPGMRIAMQRNMSSFEKLKEISMQHTERAVGVAFLDHAADGDLARP